MPIVTADKMIVERNAPDHLCGASEVRRIGDAGGLGQFGVFQEILEPGSRSSLRHWHMAEDEMIYVLSGEVLVVEGDTTAQLGPGDAATFPAGNAAAHFVHNRSSAPCKYLVVGTRAPVDIITYPDHGRRCVRIRALPGDLWIDEQGAPTLSPYRD